ncbi:Uncharacterised protein [Pseudomonas aeruginosa]|nr:Uncharacterised protein [Pseudomonas aeruginosa]
MPSPPPAPVINPSNGVVISGTAEAGATVILTDGNGNPIGQVTADGSGNWAFTPATPLANGTVINALGPGRRRQQQQSHQRHRRLAGASSPGDRSEQR